MLIPRREIQIERLVITDDCGQPVNPQWWWWSDPWWTSEGYRWSFLWNLVYDDYGQLVTASFMDYLSHKQATCPITFAIYHSHTKSPFESPGHYKVLVKLEQLLPSLYDAGIWRCNGIGWHVHYWSIHQIPVSSITIFRKRKAISAFRYNPGNSYS